MKYFAFFLLIGMTIFCFNEAAISQICAQEQHCYPFLKKCLDNCEIIDLGEARTRCRAKCRPCENYEYRSCMESAGCKVDPCPQPIAPITPITPPKQICAREQHCQPFLKKCIDACEGTPLGEARNKCRNKCRPCENYEYRSCMESAGCKVDPCPLPPSLLPMKINYEFTPYSFPSPWQEQID